MKTWSFLLGFLLLAPVVSRANTPEFSPVPSSHWSMSAIRQLNRWVSYPAILMETPQNRPLTRYEMSVGIARTIDKFGYNPQSKGDIDGLAVRDVLVALVFEYSDELARLGIMDPMTTGAIVIEDYEADKEEHKYLSPSEWYAHFQEHPWTKIIHPVGYRGRNADQVLLSRLLTVPPSVLKSPQYQAYINSNKGEGERFLRLEPQIELSKPWPQIDEDKFEEGDKE